MKCYTKHRTMHDTLNCFYLQHNAQFRGSTHKKFWHTNGLNLPTEYSASSIITNTSQHLHNSNISFSVLY